MNERFFKQTYIKRSFFLNKGFLNIFLKKKKKMEKERTFHLFSDRRKKRTKLVVCTHDD